MKEMKIGRNDAGQRLDKYLRKAVPALPPSLMQKYFRLKRIKLNSARTQGDARLREGDTLQLYINDEFFTPAVASDAWRRVTPCLSVLYEDEHILLLDKKPGLVVHEDESQGADTLINHVKAYLYSRGEWDPDAEQSFTPSLCNRIDRNTGGIVIAAKTAEALRDMNEKIRLHEVRKTYLCLVHGAPAPKAGTLRHFIRRNTDKKQVAVFDRPQPGALTAETHYRVLETRAGISLVECTLVTGRTHQIRAQMSHTGHPLVGDTKYGTAQLNQGFPFRFQALYAYLVSFPFTSAGPALEKVAGRTFEVKEVPFLDFFQNLPVSISSRKTEKSREKRT